MKILDKKIKHNIKIHDKVFKAYNLKHSEIYNKFEQGRLYKTISKIINLSGKTNPSILDVGAGTGNLSLKFLKLGCKVTSLDVSIKSLELLKKLSNDNKNLNLAKIQNKNLSFEDNFFDIVCTYSVLHHIPDYLHTVKEMIRVVKPGGLIYIDHEVNKNQYNPNKYLLEYNNLTKQTLREHLVKLFKTKELFTFEFIKGAFIKLLVDSKYQREGDIHVWKDDYIDWDKIKKIISERDCKIVEENNYLLYKPKTDFDKFIYFSKKCNNTKYVIIRKD